jgi:hypothetical protein
MVLKRRPFGISLTLFRPTGLCTKKEYSGPSDQKSSPWYDFILFRALETKLMKNITLESSFTGFLDSLKVKNRRAYLLWARKTLH